MARFSVGGDDDENEELAGNTNDTHVNKKPRRTLESPTDGATTSTAETPTPPVERETRDIVVEEEESEERSEEGLFASSSDEFELGEEERNRQRENIPQSTTHPRAKSNSSSSGNGTPVLVTLTDPEVLDCPICLEPLAPPVYQCENGHIACPSCCTNMKNKCPNCCWPIGYNRCRAIEKVLESVKIPCKNSKHGCLESLNYSKKLDHENKCTYTPCVCPHLNCNFVAMSKRLYSHFSLKHKNSSKRFFFNSVKTISFENNQEHIFLQETSKRTLFIVNRSVEPMGCLVSVVCVEPISSKRGFDYEITSRDGESFVKLKTIAESAPKWVPKRPRKKFLFVPSDFISFNVELQLEIVIWKGMTDD